MNNFDWVDAEELAASVLGLGDDYDSNMVEDGLFERFDCSFEQFHKIAECLLRLTPLIESPITKKLYHAFLKDGFSIAKIEVEVK